MLNSLCGKFGQRDDMSSTEYLKPDQWFRLLNRHKKGEVEIKVETLIDTQTLYVEYVSKDGKNTSRDTTNLALAGMVTAQARLRLYSQLSLLNERAIYCDTDSIIYHYDTEKYNIPEGDMLGEWESETSTPITKVLALAPKSYGYQCEDGKVEIKCKGISLNQFNSKKYDFDALDNLIKHENSTPIVTKRMDFVKDKKKGTITTVMNEKLIAFEPVTFKRTINTDFTTTARR